MATEHELLAARRTLETKKKNQNLPKPGADRHSLYTILGISAAEGDELLQKIEERQTKITRAHVNFASARSSSITSTSRRGLSAGPSEKSDATYGTAPDFLPPSLDDTQGPNSGKGYTRFKPFPRTSLALAASPPAISCPVPLSLSLARSHTTTTTLCGSPPPFRAVTEGLKYRDEQDVLTYEDVNMHGFDQSIPFDGDDEKAVPTRGPSEFVRPNVEETIMITGTLKTQLEEVADEFYAQLQSSTRHRLGVDPANLTCKVHGVAGLIELLASFRSADYEVKEAELCEFQREQQLKQEQKTLQAKKRKAGEGTRIHKLNMLVSQERDKFVGPRFSTKCKTRSGAKFNQPCITGSGVSNH